MKVLHVPFATKLLGPFLVCLGTNGEKVHMEVRGLCPSEARFPWLGQGVPHFLLLLLLLLARVVPVIRDNDEVRMMILVFAVAKGA